MDHSIGIFPLAVCRYVALLAFISRCRALSTDPCGVSIETFTEEMVIFRHIHVL
jgi:hypothetical protein